MKKNRAGILAGCLVLAAGLLSSAMAQGDGEIHELETNIQSRLEQHGDRVMGQNTLRWSTRLDSLDRCRAVMTVREETAMGDRTVREERVNISLGRISWINMDQSKKWITVPCQSADRCITTQATCTKTTREGVTVDCSTPGARQNAEFRLQWDGSETAGRLLERDLQRAVALCRAPVETASSFR
ncbi:MAG: hypothetical protein P4M01_12605 [Acidobacteriota bacterium]|nr:hypothetical protein [Acidobacteriota bacterium]